MTLLDGACDTTDADMEGGGLFGLSPGIRLGVAMAALDGRCAISDAEMLCDNLLEGPWGRPMILRDASWVSEARFIGLCGAADALLNWRCADAGATDLVGVSVFASRPSVGAAELRKRPVKPKMPRFLDGGSMMSFVGSETRREAETRWADGVMGRGDLGCGQGKPDRGHVHLALGLARRSSRQG
jgi:hypothetical protein